MLFSLLYMVLRAVFRLAPAGDQCDREVEILVLRHQVKVLKRKAGRPRLRRRDRLFLAAAARLPVGYKYSIVPVRTMILGTAGAWPAVRDRITAVFSSI